MREPQDRSARFGNDIKCMPPPWIGKTSLRSAGQLLYRLPFCPSPAYILSQIWYFHKHNVVISIYYALFGYIQSRLVHVLIFTARCVTVTSLLNESILHNVTYASEFCVATSSATVRWRYSAFVAKSVIVYTDCVEGLSYNPNHVYFGDKLLLIIWALPQDF
jgi:hypothetical protein